MGKTKEERREEIFTRIRPIIADSLNRPMEEVTEDKTLRDLNADSLDSVNTLMEIEKEFNIAISDADMEKFTNIRSITDYIVEHVPE